MSELNSCNLKVCDGVEVELSVIMPCLNEEKTLPVCINKAKEFLLGAGVCGEIIVADNGSIDKSVEVANGCGARVIHVSKRGYGNALIAGISAAKGRFFIMGDADDSYDFSSLNEFLGALRGGAELVVGNRFQGGISKGAMPFLHRFLGNPVLSYIGRLFYNSKLGDFHCGLRGGLTAQILALKLSSPGMEFASEMIVKATLKNLRVTEVPTVLHPDGRDRSPHLNTWADGWRHLKFLFLLNPKWLFFYPGLLIFLMGLILILATLPGVTHLGQFTLDIHSLYYGSVFFSSGVQMMFFSLIMAKISAYKGISIPATWVGGFTRLLTLERCLLLGSALLVIGAALLFRAVWGWGEDGFGGQNPQVLMRTIIPSGLMIFSGVELISVGGVLAGMELYHGEDVGQGGDL